MPADLQEVAAARDLLRRAVERDSQPTILPSRGHSLDRVAPVPGGPGGASLARGTDSPESPSDFFLAFLMLPRSDIYYKGIDIRLGRLE